MAVAFEAGDFDRDSLFVGSFAKGLAVLDAFTAARKPLKLTEIAALSGVSRSAAQRFAFTLRALGFLSQDPATKAYALTARVLELGTAYLDSNPVRRLAAPVLQQANLESEETVNLTELEGAEVVYVVRYPSRHVVSVDLALGSRVPAYCSAPGRILLAFRGETERRLVLDAKPLEKLTPRTETDRGRVERIIDQARRDGFTISDQETFVGDISTAAPVLDPAGRAIAAVNIAVPFPRWSVAAVRERLTPIVVRTASSISAALQGSRHFTLGMEQTGRLSS